MRYHLLQIVHQQTPMPVHSPDRQGPSCLPHQWRCGAHPPAVPARTVTPTVPVTVTYELTGLGLSLQQLMCDVKAWAEAHMDEVLTNRKEYDNRS